MNSSLRTLFVARGLRDFGDGFVAVLLPLYLTQLGYSAFAVGVLAGTALLGSALLTLAVGFLGIRYDLRNLLLAAAGLMTATGVALSVFNSYVVLLVVAFIGSVNPSGGSASSFVPVEHALLTREAGESGRTHAFARYSLAGGLAAAAGALAAATPTLLEKTGWSLLSGIRIMFAIYAVLGLIAGVLYRTLPRDPSPMKGGLGPSLHQSRAVVYRLAGLFSIDAFAGGFVVQSLLALWLFQRFHLSLAAASVFFFWSSILSAFSFPVAAWLSKRFGLVNTMVFTHLPSSLCLIAAAFSPSLYAVLGLLLIRAALSQMDVPTRSSYVMAVVTPSERTAAASVTSVPRTFAASISPPLAGALYALAMPASPLIICGVLKIAYDLLLLRQFRGLKPPEEC